MLHPHNSYEMEQEREQLDLKEPLAVELALNRAFVVALLLTGQEKLAEQAVTKGIARLKPGALTMDAILNETIQSCELPDVPVWHHPEMAQERSPGFLPTALQSVSRLAPLYRHCFVLRLLMRLSPDVCGHLLQLEASDVDAFASAGAQQIAGCNDVTVKH
jgi:hypothetical protein